PHPLVRFLAASFLGMVLFGTGMAVMAPLARRHQQISWQALINAIQQMARGDFRVDLPVDRDEQHHPLVRIATGIHDMAASLRAMEEMRQEFISNVSHEIGSPLTSIRGFARALKNENLSREQRMRYLDIIETECVRLSKLSENLLRLTMLESNQPPFFPAPYRLDAQLQTILLRCEPQWAEKDLDMSAELEKVVITADEDLLSQVWLNLIHNAIKFTPKGGRITIRLGRRGDKAVVTVCDTGPGIGKQDQHRIFERFYKSDKSRRRAAGGSGLGLSIAKKIVEIHHGKISVQSRPGEGAAFTVELPLQSPASPQSG
ncbi:MAG: HAMP domain-containing histidine kinase, partial [Planifilum fulgidum]